MRKLIACIIGVVALAGYPVFGQYVTYYGSRVATGYHNHTCGVCGYTWTHHDNASYAEHFCPRCKTGPWLMKSALPATETQVLVTLPPVVQAPPPDKFVCNVPPVKVEKVAYSSYKVVGSNYKIVGN